MRIDGPTGPGYSIAPTMPHHVARAYGIRTAPYGSAGVVGSIQPATPAPEPTSGRSEGVRRLVAAVVPGGVEFSATGQPASTRQPGGSAPLAMYRHPADKNAAATAVNIGRRLDVHG